MRKQEVNNENFLLICGPCQLESKDHMFTIAQKIYTITKKLDIPLLFKVSFDKANRTSIHSKRGVGLDEATYIFYKFKQQFPHIRILTDVHETTQIDKVKIHTDAIQIPAFLSRQTDLIQQACETDLIVNIKKGQFMSPYDIKHILQKCKQVRPDLKNVMITERGTSFGYNQLVVDMTGIQVMRDIITNEYPNVRLVIDGTHSVQKPGSLDGKSGGNREFVPNLTKAALTYRLGGVFLETHNDPDNAPSDGPNALHLHKLQQILTDLKKYDQFVKKSDN